MASAMSEGLRPGKWQSSNIATNSPCVAPIGQLNVRSLCPHRANPCSLSPLPQPPNLIVRWSLLLLSLLHFLLLQHCLVPVVLPLIIFGKEVPHAPPRGLQKFMGHPAGLFFGPICEGNLGG